MQTKLISKILWILAFIIVFSFGIHIYSAFGQDIDTQIQQINNQIFLITGQIAYLEGQYVTQAHAFAKEHTRLSTQRNNLRNQLQRLQSQKAQMKEPAGEKDIVEKRGNPEIINKP